MALLTSGIFQDGLKAIVYLIPLIYLILRRPRFNLKFFWVFFAGLSLLFMGHFVDFLDEFEILRTIFADEGYILVQDFFEDIVGFALGFILLMAALYLELKSIKER